MGIEMIDAARGAPGVPLIFSPLVTCGRISKHVSLHLNSGSSGGLAPPVGLARQKPLHGGYGVYGSTTGEYGNSRCT